MTCRALLASQYDERHYMRVYARGIASPCQFCPTLQPGNEGLRRFCLVGEARQLGRTGPIIYLGT